MVRIHPPVPYNGKVKTEAQLKAFGKIRESGQEFNRRAARSAREAYDKSPSLCRYCGKVISYKKRRNQFCGHSCAQSANNRGVTRHGRSLASRLHLCSNCGFQTASSSEYCSMHCRSEARWARCIAIIAQSGIVPGQHESSKGGIAKRYLKEKYGAKCSVCGIDQWMEKPAPLVLDHIDGNAANWAISNLRLTCGNCDMQLPTYKSKNRGNGREWRRVEAAKRIALIRSLELSA